MYVTECVVLMVVVWECVVLIVAVVVCECFVLIVDGVVCGYVVLICRCCSLLCPVDRFWYCCVCV